MSIDWPTIIVAVVMITFFERLNLTIRNNEKYLQDLLERVHKAAQHDIEFDRDWEWRYEGLKFTDSNWQFFLVILGFGRRRLETYAEENND